MKFFTDLRRATSGSTIGPMTPGPRNDLDSSLRKHTVTQPFVQALYVTNRRLEMHGDRNLDMTSSQRYQTLATQVESGEVSNSYAFGSSALHWAMQGNWVGFGMNSLGFLASGAYEANQRKLGRRG